MKLALAQINPTIGDIQANADRAIAAIREARAAGADLVVLPELCISGYPPKDLLLREGFVDACSSAAERIGAQTQGLTAVFGLPLPSGPAITNSLQAWHNGVCIARYDKRLLPTYDVFDEDRYFEPGARPCVIDVPTTSGPVRVGLAICEDLWKGKDAGFSSRYLNSIDPVAETTAQGAKVLVTPSASPFVLSKSLRHREILASHARAHGIFVASVNQVGGNDDLIFDGHSAIYAPDGTLLATAPGFEEHLLIVDLASPAASANPVSAPRAPALDPAAAPDEELLWNALVLGVRDYCAKTSFRSVLLGLSGGIDSALVATLATRALGPANVLGVSMPGPYSSDHSRSDARLLASNLGIELVALPIERPMDGFRAALDDVFAARGNALLGATLPDLTEENLQSRIRGTALMALSNRTGALVLTTGNKSELAVGYATLYGDMNGGLAVLSDLTKQRVYALSRWINDHFAHAGFQSPPIPPASITKPPSAELRPGQTDQDSLPPYEILDQIIERFIENHQSPSAIIRETGIDPPVVHRILRLIDISEYKRKQAATGLKVTSVAFGSGRRVPIAQRWRGA